MNWEAEDVILAFFMIIFLSAFGFLMVSLSLKLLGVV